VSYVHPTFRGIIDGGGLRAQGAGHEATSHKAIRQGRREQSPGGVTTSVVARLLLVGGDRSRSPFRRPQSHPRNHAVKMLTVRLRAGRLRSLRSSRPPTPYDARMHLTRRSLIPIVGLAVLGLGYFALPTGQASPSAFKVKGASNAAKKAPAGSPLYMDIPAQGSFPGIPGDVSSPASFKGWIALSSFSWGAACQAGHSEFSNVSVLAAVGSASPLLLQALATGETIPTVTVVSVNANPSLFPPNGVDLTYTFTNVTVSSSQDSGSSSAPPESAVSFTYGTYQVSDNPPPSGGSTPAPVTYGGTTSASCSPAP
jgi:type VI protein secretion system component Hcp